jgi:hypothetical protein
MTMYPNQDTFVRGEISPRLHARASLDLYRAGLARCQNFLTLPHGGIRKRGGTQFVAEVKDSSKRTRGIPFIYSSEQAYFLEFGHLAMRVYAYGARVGTVELATPWGQNDLARLQYAQSGDLMWLTHPDYTPQVLERVGHTSWTLEEFIFKDGPYLPLNDTPTTLTPAATGAVHPIMTTNTAPSGTVGSTGSAGTAYRLFNLDTAGVLQYTGSVNVFVSYDFSGSATKVCDAYWIRASEKLLTWMPIGWVFEGFDGTNWIVLDTRVNESGWARNEIRYFEFENKTAFLTYRFTTIATDDEAQDNWRMSGMGWHEAGDSQTAFNLTASSTVGINGGAGFQTTDVGRSIRLLGSDNKWRWARIASRASSTVVTVRLYGHALTDLSPMINWRMSVFDPDTQVDGVAIYEERIAFAQKLALYASKTGQFEQFTVGEKDDDALQFRNAGGQANDIVWLTDADGFLLIGTTAGVRALSGAGIDEALTPSSFKNRRSRAHGCARIRPADAGASFLYVAASRKAIVELTQTNVGRFASQDIGQISEHIPKRGVVEIAFQSDPDPLLWFPLDNGELGGLTFQPEQEVRGMHRQRLGGGFSGGTWGVVESVAVTPGQDGIDDVWLIVKRTINGATKRYIEIMEPPFEYGDIKDTFGVDCALVYSGAPVTSVTGASHLIGQTVSVLADARVYKGLVVSGAGGVSLPGGSPAASKWVMGLPFDGEADSLELDVGGKDGSLMGRRKRITKVILSLLETDLSGLKISSFIKGRWEQVKVQTIVAPSATATLFTGNVEVPIDDSWEGQGRVSIKHINPTPCTIRAMTPAFDSEP